MLLKTFCIPELSSEVFSKTTKIPKTWVEVYKDYTVGTSWRLQREKNINKLPVKLVECIEEVLRCQTMLCDKVRGVSDRNSMFIRDIADFFWVCLHLWRGRQPVHLVRIQTHHPGSYFLHWSWPRWHLACPKNRSKSASRPIRVISRQLKKGFSFICDHCAEYLCTKLELLDGCTSIN